MEDLPTEFGRACANIEVDEDVLELGKKILDRCGGISVDTLSSSQAEEAKRLGFACVLYLSKRVRAKDTTLQPSGVGVREILQAFDISIADFLQELPVLAKGAMPTLSMMFGDEVERKLAVRDLQTAFVHSLILGKKARDLFQRFCNLPTGSGDQPAPILRLTWLLFILAKAELLGPQPDLVTSFNLLVCVINVVLAHLPRSLGTVDFSDKVKFPVRAESGMPDTLASLALVSKTSIGEVRSLAGSLDILLQDVLGGVILADPSFQFPDGKEEANRMGFPGLLGDPGCDKALQIVEERYDKVYRNVSEIDERGFINRGEAEAAAMAFASCGATPNMTKCQVGTPVRSNSLTAATPLRLLPSPLRPASHMMKTPSPVRMGPSSYFATPGAVPGTPLTESMQLTAWLRDTTAKISAQPSEVLQGYFKACEEDVTPSILKRVHDLSHQIFPVPQSPSGGAFLQSTMARERRLEAVKLYYRVLETMLKGEESRTGKRNFTALLDNNTFHKCLIACAFEMVLASYRMVTLTFPAILERLQLKAFDLCKLIETFVRHEPSLPRELKRHLFNIEEKMLEALAWERGSSLYPKLVVACSELATGADIPHSGKPLVGQAVPEENGSPRKSPAQEDNGTDEAEATSSQNTPTKRSLEGSPEVSPTKLQKGSESQRVQPDPQSPPKSPTAAQQTPLDSVVMDATPINRRQAGLLSPQRQSNTSAFSAFLSPLRPDGSGDFNGQLGTLPTAFGSPTEHLERPGRAIIADFLRKVLKLGLLRLADLCDRMDFEPLDRKDILTQVYTMMQHVLYDHTHLLYNRHLDQVLLSALYGVCKVNSLKQISFKEIIQHYKKQPQAKTDIFRMVIIQQGEPELTVAKTGDIIEFYNAVYIPTVKAFVLKLGSNKAQLAKLPSLSVGGAKRTLMSPAAPAKIGFSTPPAADRVMRGSSPVQGKVFVSPLRQSPKQPFLTPRSKMIYAGRMGESAHAYQSPSKDLKYINSRIAAHSQQPFLAVPPQPAAEAPTGGNSQMPAKQPGTSSDRSCSTGRSSGVEPSHSNSRYSEPVSSSGMVLRHSKPASQERGSGMSPLDVMARAAAQGQRNNPGQGGGSGLEDLHNAAMLLGTEGGQPSHDNLPNGNGSMRRSRRQAGQAPGV